MLRGAEMLAEQGEQQTGSALEKQDDREARWNQKTNETIHSWLVLVVGVGVSFLWEPIFFFFFSSSYLGPNYASKS